MAITGPKPKRRGTSIGKGQGIQTTCYPRKHTRSLLVAWAEKEDIALSAFLILAGLEKIARAKSIDTPGITVEAEDLIPAEEYAELLRKRGGKSKS
jgi:hypothetical protein